MSNFLEIDFAIKTNDKKITTFRPLHGHFQERVKKKISKIGISMFLTVKRS